MIKGIWIKSIGGKSADKLFINIQRASQTRVYVVQGISIFFQIHRAGEGASYTGLKPGAEVDPAIALADKALESGSVDKLFGVLTDATAKGIRDRFHRALETRKHADESVTAGRDFVEAYVGFTHYVKELHTSVKGGTGHHEHQ